MRVLLAVCLVVAALSGASAKILTVSGRGVLLTVPPPNVYSAVGTNDTPSSTIIENGVPYLAVTAFNEKQGVVLANDLQVSDNPTLILRKGIPYDASFLFFHQKRPNGVNQAATAEFHVDNRFVGCALDAGNVGKYELITTPYFGLSNVDYPTTTEAARCFEGDDGVLGAGTNFTSHHTITQPGDYVRCFSATCVDSNGGSCQCSTTFNPICVSPMNEKYTCFATPAALLSSRVGSAAFQFSSTCPVDVSSVVGTVQSCSAANGCKLQADGSICLKSSSTPSSVDLHITAGCGCDQVVTATFQGSNSATGCAVADVELDPPASSCGANCQVSTANCNSAAAQATTTTGDCVSLQFNC